jgi:hypothetical protein
MEGRARWASAFLAELKGLDEAKRNGAERHGREPRERPKGTGGGRDQRRGGRGGREILNVEC